MKQFVLFINSRQVMETYSPVIRAVLAHFYVVTIHPFRDGNGRTSRAVEAFILFQAGYNVRGFYSLANFYYRNRAAYIRMLQEARFKHHGDMNEYVLFSLRGFLAELETVKEETTSFLRSVLFKNYVQELLSTSKLIKTNSTRKRLISFVLWLIDQHPDGIEIKTVKERADGFIAGLYRGVASVRTIERDLMLLLKCRLLRSQDGKLFPNLALMQEYES
jgi:Fic family protein